MKLKSNAVHHLQATNSIFIISGSGISEASGIPTYRGTKGFYKDSSRILHFSDLKNNMAKVWEKTMEMRKLVIDKKPNAAHNILASWEKNNIFPHFGIATQNIDGLHQQAGSISVCELHGNIWKVARKKDIACTDDQEFSDENTLVHFDEFRDDILKKWSEENGYTVWEDKKLTADNYEYDLRPHIQLFDEPYRHRLLWVYDFIQRGIQILLIIGCSGKVSIVDKIIDKAKTHNSNCLIIDINPEDTLVDADIKMRCSALDGLLILDDILKSESNTQSHKFI